MKKLLLSIFISAASVCAFAQINPTRDFEAWVNPGSGAVEEPRDWVTGNKLVNPLAPGNIQSVYKVTGGDAHGGTYAMKIVTVDVGTNPSTAVIPDPIGFAATGSATIIPSVSLKIGYPYTSRPANAEFWYKYTPVGTDTASFVMWLTKWNGTSRDTVAYAYWETTAALSAYAKITAALVYKPGSIVPDTAGIIFSATGTGCLTCGNVGSTLWIDDLDFLGTNGINENPSSSGVTLYPNPASDRITITVDGNTAVSASVYDATGRAVAVSSELTQTSVIRQRTGTIDTSSLPSGLYSYSVIDKSGNVINAGKFNVVK